MNNPDPQLRTLATARAILLEPFGLDDNDLDQAFAAMARHQIDYGDLYFQHTRSEGWSLEEGIVKSGSFSIDQGVGVRAISGEKTAFAFSDALSREALLGAARTVRTIGAAGGSAQVATRRQTDEGKLLYEGIDPLGTLDATAKVRLLERIETMARQSDSRVVQVMASIAGEYDVVLIVTSEGRMAADVRPLVRVNVTVIAEENGRREMGSAGGGGRCGYDFFADEQLAQYVKRAVHEATTNLSAQPAPAGIVPVVLGSGWPGVLLHEAIGHGLEGDFNRKGSSAFAGRIGDRVAARGVTVVDDGTLPNRRGSLNIDDEGHPTSCTTLIEDGILTGYLQDSLNARLMNMPTTGNARRESYAHLPMPRMTNTYMRAGDTDPDEIIASIDKGLYAVNFAGGQVDITSGKFVFSMSEAYWVEKGKIRYPVRGATLIGNGPDALTRVSMIGNDLALDSGVGVCGKEGQSVPVGVGQPTLRIEGLTVGGTAATA